MEALYHHIDNIKDSDVIVFDKGNNFLVEQKWSEIDEKFQDLIKKECTSFHGKRYYKIKK